MDYLQFCGQATYKNAQLGKIFKISCRVLRTYWSKDRVALMLSNIRDFNIFIIFRAITYKPKLSINLLLLSVIVNVPNGVRNGQTADQIQMDPEVMFSGKITESSWLPDLMLVSPKKLQRKLPKNPKNPLENEERSTLVPVEV